MKLVESITRCELNRSCSSMNQLQRLSQTVDAAHIYKSLLQQCFFLTCMCVVTTMRYAKNVENVTIFSDNVMVLTGETIAGYQLGLLHGDV